MKYQVDFVVVAAALTYCHVSYINHMNTPNGITIDNVIFLN